MWSINSILLCLHISENTKVTCTFYMWHLDLWPDIVVQEAVVEKNLYLIHEKQTANMLYTVIAP